MCDRGPSRVSENTQETMSTPQTPALETTVTNSARGMSPRSSTVLLSGRSDDDTGCDRRLLSRFQRSGRSSARKPSGNVTSVLEEQKQETGENGGKYRGD